MNIVDNFFRLKEKPEIIYELGKEALKAKDFPNA